jgi:hypothetical protein
MNTSDIRFTDTNSADDSKGKTWGLDGNLFWYVIGGGFTSVCIMLLLFSSYRMSFFTSAAIAVIPLILMLIYVFAFRQPPLALSVPLSRFTSRVGGGSAFFVRQQDTPHKTRNHIKLCNHKSWQEPAHYSSWFISPALLQSSSMFCDCSAGLSAHTKRWQLR